jgi:hypothetical protein
MATRILHGSELKISVILKDEKALHRHIETSKCFKSFSLARFLRFLECEEFWNIVLGTRLRWGL